MHDSNMNQELHVLYLSFSRSQKEFEKKRDTFFPVLNKKQKNEQFNLSYVNGYGRLAEGKGHKTDSNWKKKGTRLTQFDFKSVSCLFSSASLPHSTDTRLVE